MNGLTNNLHFVLRRSCSDLLVLGRRQETDDVVGDGERRETPFGLVEHCFRFVRCLAYHLISNEKGFAGVMSLIMIIMHTRFR